MADIFVSYASEDLERVKPLVTTLEEQGWSVWWDRELVAGPSYEDKIEEALDEARCVVVIWSSHSIKSQWVRTEAHEGLEREILVPLLIDDIKPPLAYRIAQTAKLIDWPDQAGQLENVIDGITDLLGKSVNTDLPVVKEKKSIAVLPFINMSSDPEQEYFSDGISEELLNLLSKIHDLRVAARTSSSAFKGKNQDIREIGSSLNVKTVLEGSVRKSGNHLRITAQLIDVKDGYHLWSATYDRDLTDIFEIQDEISASIVDALKVHLTDRDNVTSTKVIDVEAYNFYLLARDNMHRSTDESLTLAASRYQRALDINPDYAEAWAGKAMTTHLMSIYGNLSASESIKQTQLYLDKVFSLDADIGAAHATQARLYSQESRHPEALASLQRGIELSPSEGIFYVWQANELIVQAQFNQAYESIKRGFNVDPLHPVVRESLAFFQVSAGDEELARSLVTPGSSLAFDVERRIASRNGEHTEAVNAIKKAIDLSEGFSENYLRRSLSDIYFFCLKNPELAMQDLPDEDTLFYQAVISPESAYPRLRQLPDDLHNNETLWALVWSHICQKDYEEALITLGPKDLQKVTLSGYATSGFNDISLAHLQAYCLQQLGKVEEAFDLINKVQQHIYFAINNGQPPLHFELLARCQLILAECDLAMQSLNEANNNHYLDWANLRGPWYDPLRDRKEFQELKQGIQNHLNAEREKLGWAPVTI